MTKRYLKRHLKNCEACDLPFRSARRDARFCSASCRQAAHRARAVTELSPDVTADASPVTKPRTQLAHDIAQAKAWIDWAHDERPQL